MSIGSVGGDPAQLIQVLREARANRANPGGPAKTAPSASGPKPGGDVDAPAAAQPAPGAANGIGTSAAQILTDLKSLFLDLQSALGGKHGSASPGAGKTPSTADANTPNDPLQGLSKAVQAYGAQAYGSPKPVTALTA